MSTYHEPDPQPASMKKGPPKRSSAPKPLSLDAIKGKAVRLRQLRDDAEKMKTDASILADELVPIVSNQGTLQPSGKSTVLEIDNVKITLMRGTRESFDEDKVLALLTERGKIAQKDLVAMATKKVLDPEQIKILFQTGYISAKDIDNITVTKEQSPVIKVTVG